MSDISQLILHIVVAAMSGSLCYMYGYGHANDARDALAEELRQTKAKLDALTDRDEKGRFVRREL